MSTTFLKTIPFNINSYVRVKLTDHGRRLLQQQHEELARDFPYFAGKPDPTYREDEDGWSRWQLWSLMERLGADCRPTRDLPILTNIEIEVNS